jgi:hypothetical protein
MILTGDPQDLGFDIGVEHIEVIARGIFLFRNIRMPYAIAKEVECESKVLCTHLRRKYQKQNNS